jgi:signal peptidase I
MMAIGQRQWTVLALALLAACRKPHSSPTPSQAADTLGPTLAERAPARTRLLARVATGEFAWTSQLWDGVEEELAAGRAAGTPIKTLDQCGVDKSTALGVVEVAIGEPFQVIVEVHGSLSVAAVSCVLGMQSVDGQFSFAGFTLADLPRGGLRFSNVADSGGASLPLRERFQSLAARHAGVAIAATGSADFPVESRWLLVGTQSRFEIDFGSEAVAASAHSWLFDALAVAARTDSAVADLGIGLQGRTLSVKPPPDQDKAMALSRALKPRVLESFKMPSGSMEPTLLPGEHFFVGKGTAVGTARRGDVVAFRAPDSGAQYVKRVVGLAGDQIELRDEGLFVNGKETAVKALGTISIEMPGSPGASLEGTRWQERLDGRTYETIRSRAIQRPNARWMVPAGHVFVIGDNRDNSYDSRSFGPILQTSILGRVLCVFYSMGSAGLRWDRIGTPVE